MESVLGQKRQLGDSDGDSADGDLAEDDDDLSKKPASSNSHPAAASVKKPAAEKTRPVNGGERKSKRQMERGRKKRFRVPETQEDDDESMATSQKLGKNNNNHANVDTNNHTDLAFLKSLAKIADHINTIELVPTQEAVEKDDAGGEEKSDDETDIELVDCGEDYHEKYFDDFESTPHSVYFREGGKFFGRVCGRCNIEFSDKKEYGKIKPSYDHPAFYCPRYNCPFTLCSKCRGLVLVAGGNVSRSFPV